MRSISLPVLLGLVLYAVTACHADARAVKFWNFEELTQQSDVVAIIVPMSNENNSDAFDWPGVAAQGITTKFKVLCWLKGTPNGDTLPVKHFIFRDVVPVNAGTLINFLVGPLELTATIKRNGKSEDWNLSPATPRWLAFLKKSPDGTYAPTSGQVDPDSSFQELHGPLMYATLYTTGP